MESETQRPMDGFIVIEKHQISFLVVTCRSPCEKIHATLKWYNLQNSMANQFQAQLSLHMTYLNWYFINDQPIATTSYLNEA